MSLIGGATKAGGASCHCIVCSIERKRLNGWQRTLELATFARMARTIAHAEGRNSPGNPSKLLGQGESLWRKASTGEAAAPPNIGNSARFHCLYCAL